VVAAAAFVLGGLFNKKTSPLNLFGAIQGGNVQIIPAEELPEIRADIIGLLSERKDNFIFVEQKGSKISGGPEVEIVITHKTIIYKETTDMSGILPSGENQTIQQTVGEGKLDDLGPHALVMVWGRKSGDRIVADMLFYSNVLVIQKP